MLKNMLSIYREEVDNGICDKCGKETKCTVIRLELEDGLKGRKVFKWCDECYKDFSLYETLRFLFKE